MNKVFWIAGSAGAALLLSSCVTYPYDTAFNACEREANDCYRLCEEIPDEGGYVACQAHCDRDIDRCFDTAYAPYSGYGYGGYGGGGYGYGSPWYGRYGSWYPNNGYYMSFNYYDRYGYRKKRQEHRYGDDTRSRPDYGRTRDAGSSPRRPVDPDSGIANRTRRPTYGTNPTNRRAADPDRPDAPPPTSSPPARRAPNAPPQQPSQSDSPSPPPSTSGSRRPPTERPRPDSPDRDID